MARLATIGIELGHILGDGGTTVALDTTCTLDASTAQVRSGTYAGRAISGSTSGTAIIGYPLAAQTTATTRYYRAWVYFGGFPDATASVIYIVNALRVRVDSAGQLVLRDAAGTTTVSTNTATISTGAWHSIEIALTYVAAGNDTISWSVDGTVVDSGLSVALTATAPTDFRIGWLNAPGTNRTMYWDDIAINDDSGSNENAAPDRISKVVVLKAASISNAGSWTGGAGGAIQVGSINTTPPGGTNAETDATQIESASTSGSNTLSLVTGTYTAAGINLIDTITLTQPFVIDGEDVGTGDKTADLRISANPTQAPGSYLFTVAVAGASNALGVYPTNWFRHAGLISYSPSVTLGTGATIALVDDDTSNRVQSYCFIGVLVEYIPSIVNTPVATTTGVCIYPTLIGMQPTRYVTEGFELGTPYPSSGTVGPEFITTVIAASCTLGCSTDQARSGLYALKAVSSGSGGASYGRLGVSAQAGGVTRFYRFWIYVDTLPASDVPIIIVANGFRLHLNASGTLQLNDPSSVQIGTQTTTISTGGWHSVEVDFTYVAAGNDTVSWRFDGTTIEANVSQAVTASAPGNTDIGWISTPGNTKTIYFDDVAIADHLASQREAKIILLKAVSVATNDAWTGGAGGAVQIGSISTVPPGGTDSETDATQIESASATSNALEVVTETYTAAGIGADDVIFAIHALAVHGEDSATGTITGGLRLANNPDQSTTLAFSYGNDVGALGVYPVNWRGARSLLTTAQPTKGTGATVRVTDSSLDTNVASICFVGAIVEYLATVVAFDHQLHLRNLPANAVYRM